MANGLVEIHDPLANRKDLNGHAPPEAVPDSLEFRMLRAYAQRRRRGGNNNNNDMEESGQGQTGVIQVGGGLQGQTGPIQGGGGAASSPTTPTKKKKRWTQRLPKVFRCIKPQTDDAHEDAEDPQDGLHRCLVPSAGRLEPRQEEGGELEEAAAASLLRIVDEIPFTPPDVEPDAPGDDVTVEKMLGLLLRESGDRLNEKQELSDLLTATRLSWNYIFFERLIQAMLRRMGLLTPDPDAPGPQTSPKTQMAVTCEVATRLSAADTLPANRLLGYGATYLQKHISPWAMQQGGYDAVFDEDDDDDDVQ